MVMLYSLKDTHSTVGHKHLLIHDCGSSCGQDWCSRAEYKIVSKLGFKNICWFLVSSQFFSLRKYKIVPLKKISIKHINREVSANVI